ncbi:MAG: hypothetical protein PHD87_07075 [Candidatus Cloacimonetes bacterium]|nr:hypothetical protein [Candidatus Cloacimonadota bacterium]
MADYGMVAVNPLYPVFLYQFQRDGSRNAQIPGNLTRQRKQRIEGLIYLQVQFSDFVAGNEGLGSDDRSFERFGQSFGGFDQLEFTPVVFLDPTDYANKIQAQAVFDQAYDIALDLVAFVADKDVFGGVKGQMALVPLVLAVWAMGDEGIAAALQIVAETGGQAYDIDTGLEFFEVQPCFFRHSHLHGIW